MLPACRPGYIYITDAIDQRQYFAYAHRFVCQMHNVHLHIPLSVALLISSQNAPQRGNLYTSFSCCFFFVEATIFQLNDNKFNLQHDYSKYFTGIR